MKLMTVGILPAKDNSDFTSQIMLSIQELDIPSKLEKLTDSTDCSKSMQYDLIVLETGNNR